MIKNIAIDSLFIQDRTLQSIVNGLPLTSSSVADGLWGRRTHIGRYGRPLHRKWLAEGEGQRNSRHFNFFQLPQPTDFFFYLIERILTEQLQDR